MSDTMVLRRKDTFTVITPIPSFIPRQLAIDILHSHGEVIKVNPLVLDYQPIAAPRNCATDEYYSTWYEITERIQYIPGLGRFGSGKISFNGCFHDLPWGLQTHIYAPAGVELRSKYRVGGNQPGEPPELQEIGLSKLGAPRDGLYLREDIEIKCNFTVMSFVRSQMKAASKDMVDRIIKKAELLDAGVLQGMIEDGRLKTLNPNDLRRYATGSASSRPPSSRSQRPQPQAQFPAAGFSPPQSPASMYAQPSLGSPPMSPQIPYNVPRPLTLQHPPSSYLQKQPGTFEPYHQSYLHVPSGPGSGRQTPEQRHRYTAELPSTQDPYWLHQQQQQQQQQYPPPQHPQPQQPLPPLPIMELPGDTQYHAPQPSPAQPSPVTNSNTSSPDPNNWRWSQQTSQTAQTSPGLQQSRPVSLSSDAGGQGVAGLVSPPLDPPKPFSSDLPTHRETKEEYTTATATATGMGTGPRDDGDAHLIPRALSPAPRGVLVNPAEGQMGQAR